MTEATATYDIEGQCALESCRKPAKPGGRFCCPKHRAAWNRENGGVVPARVQSLPPTANGDLVLVVRVRGHAADRVRAWRPSMDVEVMERER